MNASASTKNSALKAAARIVAQARVYDARNDTLNRDRCLREAANAYGEIGQTGIKGWCERFITKDVEPAR